MSLQVEAVVRRGGFVLDAELAAADGEVVALLGPNGAGKSTLLRTVAGLVALDAGRVLLGGQVLDDPAAGVLIAPQQRRLGVVFQDHRLFPHLRVRDNVAFGPRSRGAGAAAARTSAEQWLERLGVGELAGRYPKALSGGQAQRVALARALASEPRALLLDEPLAALDVQTRAEVQGELRRHLTSFAGPTLLVTHDPIEALLLAGRIVVLEGGSVVQSGTPAEVTTRPLTPYVARLVGMNLLVGRVAGGGGPAAGPTGGGMVVEVDGGGRIVAPAGVSTGRVLAAVRPGAITVHTSPPDGTSARNVWPGTVIGLAPLGDRIRLDVAGEVPLTVDVTAAAVAELALAPGLSVWLSAKAVDVSVYPAP